MTDRVVRAATDADADADAGQTQLRFFELRAGSQPETPEKDKSDDIMRWETHEQARIISRRQLPDQWKLVRQQAGGSIVVDSVVGNGLAGRRMKGAQ